MSAAARNIRVTQLMAELFAEALHERPSLSYQIQSDLEEVFTTPARGFREILLVITIARLLNPDFKASVDFYEANPRALFEGPIRNALRSRHIPHGKSGPLNVAKATRRIDDQWAARRRPRKVADRIVALVDHIESLPPGELRSFAIDLHGRFLDEAHRIASMAVDVEPNAEILFLLEVCQRLVEDAPDAGNTLQRIAGLLLTSYHDAMQTGIIVSGAEDRASVTTTTSKKLGDLAEEQPDGTIVRVFEVTTKPFNEARVVEAYDAVREYDGNSGSSTPEVVVVCEAGQQHQDAVGARLELGYLGVLTFNDLAFHFVEIWNWIMANLIRMPVDARIAFYESLGAYVADPNTAERVKTVWQRLHPEG